MRIFLRFLKLGATAFGGPLAHVAIMESEWVERRQVVRREDFLRHLALVQLLPGPNSTELAMHLGYEEGGWKGFWGAGIGFILPAFACMLLLAWAYEQSYHLPWVEPALLGVRSVMLGIIARAWVRLARGAWKRSSDLALGLACAAWVAFGGSEIPALLVAGLATLWGTGKTFRVRLSAWGFPVAAWSSSALPGAQDLFFYFAKVGSFLFGSGYVLFAFLHRDLVVRLGWLTQGQLVDAIVLGQLTPGPLFTSATFVGYLLGGWTGACAATLGIFLPAFAFSALAIAWADRIRERRDLQTFLRGVVAASVGLLLWFTIDWTIDLSMTPGFLALSALAYAVRMPPILLIALGALAGHFAAAG